MSIENSPAFPRPVSTDERDTPCNIFDDQVGMTLLQHYAGLMMQANIIGARSRDVTSGMTAEDFAVLSVRQARALCIELAKPAPKDPREIYRQELSAAVTALHNVLKIDGMDNDGEDRTRAMCGMIADRIENVLQPQSADKSNEPAEHEYRGLLLSAMHGLRSYQYSNDSGDLAASLASKIEKFISPEEDDYDGA